MSQAETLAAFDADVFAAFADIGLADVAVYTPAAGGGALPAFTVLVNRTTQYVAADGQLRSDRVTIEIRRADVDLPRRGDTLVVGSETFVVDRIELRDESRSIVLVSDG